MRTAGNFPLNLFSQKTACYDKKNLNVESTGSSRSGYLTFRKFSSREDLKLSSAASVSPEKL